MNRHVSDFTLQKKSSCKTKRSHAITWLWIIRTVGSGPRSLAIGGWLFRLMRPLNIIRPAFLVLLLSETVLSETVLVVSPISTLRGTVRLSSFLELCTFRTHCRPCTRGSEDRRVASSQCVLFSNPNRCRSVLWVSSNITRKG